MFNTHLLHSRGLRSTILAIGLSLNLGTLLGAEGEKAITSKITEAKVFLSGAQITRSASSALPTGSSTLVFSGLAQGIDPQSIQVTGKGGYSILSVNQRINYLTESPKKAEIEDLQKRIKQYEHDWNIEKGLQQVWEVEEQLLLKNNAIGGQQNGVTAAQLQGGERLHTRANEGHEVRLVGTAGETDHHRCRSG